MYIQLLCILQFYLSAIVDHVDPRVKSAAIPFQRPVSTGTQTYGTNPNNYPITQPMTKMTALLQVYISCCYTMCSVCTHMNFCAISPYFILGLRWGWVHNRYSHPTKRMCCSLCSLNTSKVALSRLCVYCAGMTLLIFTSGECKDNWYWLLQCQGTSQVSYWTYYIIYIELQVMTGYIVGLTAADIPGTNDFFPFGGSTPEPVR